MSHLLIFTNALLAALVRSAPSRPEPAHPKSRLVLPGRPDHYRQITERILVINPARSVVEVNLNR